MPIQFNWQRTYAWERAHSNSAEILESDPHSDRVYEVVEATDLDEDEAFRAWLTLAQGGSIYSMNEAAYCYEIGRGIDQDLSEAERWYAEAFAGGSQIAMIRCAHRMAGRKDYQACIAILQSGVDGERPPAFFWQAWYRLKQCDDAKTRQAIRPMLETASEAGHPGAEWYLARLMAKGVYGSENKASGRRRLLDLSSKIAKEIDSSAEA
jgi:TPR repeat protein